MMEWKRARETDCDLSFCNSKALELNTLALRFLSPLRGHCGLVDSAIGDFLGPQVPNEEHATHYLPGQEGMHTGSVSQVLSCRSNPLLSKGVRPPPAAEDEPGQERGTFWRDADFSGAMWLISVLGSVLTAQSCPTLCSPVDGSPPGSSVHGILQARILK